MHTSFYLFLVAFVVSLYASLKLFKKLKDFTEATENQEKALLGEMGIVPEHFYHILVCLFASCAEKQRFDVGVIQFIYNYIKTVFPEKCGEYGLAALHGLTGVLEGGRFYPLFDINQTFKKDQIIFIEENLRKLSATEVEFNILCDDENFIGAAKTACGKFSEAGRKYIAYLLCKSACAALRNKADFPAMKELFAKAFNLNADAVDELAVCGSEDRLDEWYSKHIQCDAQKNYPPCNKFVDILRVEFPSMPPYDWKKKRANTENLWSAALYLVLLIIVCFGLCVFKGSTLVIFLLLPLFLIYLIFSIAGVMSRFFSDSSFLEDNKFNWKPIRIIKFSIVCTFVALLILTLRYLFAQF